MAENLTRQKAKNEQSKSWWTTLPGILSGITGIITAITGLVIALGIGKGDKIEKWTCTGERCELVKVEKKSDGFSTKKLCIENTNCNDISTIQNGNNLNTENPNESFNNGNKESNKNYTTKAFNGIIWMGADLKKAVSPSDYKLTNGRYFYKPSIRRSLCPQGWRLPLAGEFFGLFDGQSRKNLQYLNFTQKGRMDRNQLSNLQQFTYLVDGGIVSFNDNKISESVTSGGRMYYPCRCVKK